MAFFWDDLLEDIIHRRKVVAVVGPDLLGVTEQGGQVPFYRELARLTAGKLGGIEGLPLDADWAALEKAVAGRKVDRRGQFTFELNTAHNELLASTTTQTMPEPLRLLAEIDDFPLVLTTNIDGLIGKALGVSDKAPPGSTGNVALASKFDRCADLPKRWTPAPQGSPPTLLHLFGRINSVPDYALTEEDVLEMMFNLQGKSPPTELLSRLRHSDVLMLGTRFPDWLARFFLRLVRGDRLSREDMNASRDNAFGAVLADTEAQPKRPLVAFLKTYSPYVQIFEEGTPADFVRELNRRWKALKVPTAKPEPVSDEREMIPGSIFISYASADRPAAAAVAARLEKDKLDVWFDRNQLQHGNNYDLKIKDNIGHCDLFVHILSHNTDARTEGYLVREWEIARERRLDIKARIPFMMPIVIDNLDFENSTDFADYCQPGMHKVNALRAPGGILSDDDVKAFKSALRQVRSPKSAAVA
jgi:hypothetical protein